MTKAQKIDFFRDALATARQEWEETIRKIHMLRLTEDSYRRAIARFEGILAGEIPMPSFEQSLPHGEPDEI